MPFSVGKSSYPGLKGVTQYVADASVAAQVASLCYEFDTQVARGGDRLTVNEGIRSRERQAYLYNQYLYHGGALAASPYTSTHDHTRGSALDFGITRPDGSNRALTSDEFAWLHAHAPRRGILWTGANFIRVEPWHHNGGYAASLPPITGVNVPGEPIGNPVEHDETETIIRRALVAVADTLTYYQRQSADGKTDQNVYFVAGPGIFLDIVTAKGDQWLASRTGLASPKLREVLNREGVKAVKIPARDYDERRALYIALFEASQGKAK